MSEAQKDRKNETIKKTNNKEVEVNVRVFRSIMETIRMLLKPAKTIRDPIHGDIVLTVLEVELIDTSTFQRLKGLKQLGTTHYVYPSANHTRFEHSIGTLYTSMQIVNAVNTNPYRNYTIRDSDIFFIRLIALLHDLSNLPFGHTLEDEGNIFDSQWDDIERFNHCFGPNTPIRNVVENNEVIQKLFNLNKSLSLSPNYEAELSNFPSLCTCSVPIMRINNTTDFFKVIEEKIQSIDLNDSDISLVRSDLNSKQRKDFISDIVGNTLCADLLDYVKRDIYFCGLKESFDDRLVSYLYVNDFKDKSNQTNKRLLLRLIKPKTGAVRRDIIFEMLHLMRLRYSLAEKIYYHHTKIYTSAMLMSAVVCIVNDVENNKEDVKKLLEKFYDLTDDEFMRFVYDYNYKKETNKQITQKIVSNLKLRQIYKPVFKMHYSTNTVNESSFNREKIIKKYYGDNENKAFMNRYMLERRLEEINGLEKGSVVVYCPSQKMSNKTLKTLVEYSSNSDSENPMVACFEECVSEDIMKEIDFSIKKKHDALWCFYVLASQDIGETKKIDLSVDSEEILNERNQLHNFRNKIPSYIIRYENKYCIENNDKYLPNKVLETIAYPKYKKSSSLGALDEYLDYSTYVTIRNEIKQTTNDET